MELSPPPRREREPTFAGLWKSYYEHLKRLTLREDVAKGSDFPTARSLPLPGEEKRSTCTPPYFERPPLLEDAQR